MTTSPDYAVPAGEYIAEWIDENDMTAAELARRLGVSRKHVSELLRGKVSLSHELAIALENVTAVPARRWNQLEALHQEDRARVAIDATLAAQYERAKAFPLRYLRTLGIIQAPARDKAGTVRQLSAFFGVADLDAWQHSWGEGSVAYRKTAVRTSCPEHLSTWLTVGERCVGDLASLPPFDPNALQRELGALRALTRADAATAPESARQLLAGVGVVLCFVPPAPGLGVYGATRWLHGHPVVQLSLRGKTDDQLWFTLFHELGHVLLHPHNGLYLSDATGSAEDEANAFAADFLISPADAERLPRGRNKDAIRTLAEEIGVSAGVVLGRAQRATGDYAWGQDLKVRYEFDLAHHRNEGN
jgi:HTH-type transcriptional regulator/antitoxin HigA